MDLLIWFQNIIPQFSSVRSKRFVQWGSSSNPLQKELWCALPSVLSQLPPPAFHRALLHFYISHSWMSTKPATSWTGQDVPAAVARGQSKQLCWVEKRTKQTKTHVFDNVRELLIEQPFWYFTCSYLKGCCCDWQVVGLIPFSYGAGRPTRRQASTALQVPCLLWPQS